MHLYLFDALILYCLLDPSQKFLNLDLDLQELFVRSIQLSIMKLHLDLIVL